MPVNAGIFLSNPKSRDKLVDFGFGEADQGGDLPERQAVLPPEKLCECYPAFRLKAANVTESEQGLAFVRTYESCFRILHGNT